MKTKFLLVAAAILAAGSLPAQDNRPGCPENAAACPAQPICAAPATCPTQVYCNPTATVCYPRPATTVTYIGGGPVYTRYYYASCNSRTQVIFFCGRPARRQRSSLR